MDGLALTGMTSAFMPVCHAAGTGSDDECASVKWYLSGLLYIVCLLSLFIQPCPPVML